MNRQEVPEHRRQSGRSLPPPPPPTLNPLYNEVSNSFFNQVFSQMSTYFGHSHQFQLIIQVKPHGKLVFTHHYIKKHILPIFPPIFPPIFSL